MTIREHIDRLIEELLSDDLSDHYRVFQRLILYKKLLENPSGIDPYKADHPAYESAQEYLIKCGLLIKLRDKLKIATLLYQHILDKEWIEQKLNENPTYREMLEWSEKLLADNSEDKFCSFQRLIILRNILNSQLESIPAYSNVHTAYTAQEYLKEIGLITEKENRLTLANPRHRNTITTDFIQEKLQENLFYRLIQKLLQKIPVELEKIIETAINNIKENDPDKIETLRKILVTPWHLKCYSKCRIMLLRALPIIGPVTVIPLLLFLILPCAIIPLSFKCRGERGDKHCQVSTALTKEIKPIDELGTKAFNYFNSDNSDDADQIDSLILALESVYQLEPKIKNDKCILEYSTLKPLLALQYILGQIYEKNRHNEHDFTVNTLSFSQDDRYLASADDNGSILIWDLNSPSNKPIQITSDQGNIKSINFIPNPNNPNHPILVTGGTKNYLKFWNVLGQNIQTNIGDNIEKKDNIEKISLSSDGKILATFSSLEANGKESIVQLLNSECNSQLCQLKLIKTLEGKEFRSISLSPNKNQQGYLIATSNRKGKIELWTLSEQQEIKSFVPVELEKIRQQQGIESVRFTAKGDSIITRKKTGEIELWDLQGNLHNQPLKIGNSISIPISIRSQNTNTNNKDNEYIITTGNNGKLELYRIFLDKDNRTKRVSKVNYEVNRSFIPLYSISAGYTGKYLATGDKDKEKKDRSKGYSVRLWDISKLDKYYETIFLDTEEKIKELEIGNHNGPTYIPYITYLTNNSQVRVINDIKQPIYLDHLKLGKVTHISIFTDTTNPNDLSSSRLLTVENDKLVKIWNFSDLKISTSTPIKFDIKGIGIFSGKNISKVILGKDNYFVIISSSGEYALIDQTKGKAVLGSYNTGKYIKTARFSPNGKYLVTVEMDSDHVTFWDLETKSPTPYPIPSPNSSPTPLPNSSWFSQKNIKQIILSPDTKYILTLGEDDLVKLWSWPNPNEIPELKSLQELANEKVTGVAFYPNQNQEFIATATGNKIKLWNYQGRQIAQFNGDWTEDETKTKSVNFSFTTNGKYIYVYLPDNGKIQSWNIGNINLDNPSPYLKRLITEGCNWLDDYLKNPEAQKLSECSSITPSASKP